MTIKNTTLTALVSLALLVGLSNSALARNGGGMNANNQQGQYRNMPNSNLTAEQQAEAQKIITKFQTDTLETRQKILAKQLEYRTLLNSQPVDEQKVLAVSQEIKTLRDSMYQSRVTKDMAMAKAGIPMIGRQGGKGGMQGGNGGMQGGNGGRGGRNCQ